MHILNQQMSNEIIWAAVWTHSFLARESLIAVAERQFAQMIKSCGTQSKGLLCCSNFNQWEENVVSALNEVLSNCNKLTNVVFARWQRMIQKELLNCIRENMELLDCLVHWIACIKHGKIAPSHCRVLLQGKSAGQHSCLRQWQTLTCGYGMLILDLCVTLNDLSIWENTLLLDNMVSGAFLMINFTFETGGCIFEIFLVDVM